MPDRPGHFHRHRFPAEVISYAVWLYYRFPLSHRDVEELLSERGIQVSYEAVRRWANKFGPIFAEDLRRRRVRPGRTWHLDEVFLRMNGRRVYLWRAVDEHGQVLDILVQARRDAAAAERFFRRLLDRVGDAPERIVTDKLASYAAARERIPELESVKHVCVRAAARLNNRIEQSHQSTRVRERRMQRFKSMSQAQRFLSTFSHICNLFRPRRHLLAAATYRITMQDRFHIWYQITRVAA
ncbi:MAG: IS6 family transposase [Gemmatimonadetes bacterium]|jgi:putative transposase|nr:IS6 family transposase [Gemmatimonadota bacterium]